MVEEANGDTVSALLYEQFGILQHQANFSGGVVEVTFPRSDHGDDFPGEGGAGLQHE